LGAKKVILYSNTKNAGAIKLYEKIGFQHVEVEQGIYKRANVKNGNSYNLCGGCSEEI